MAEIGADINPYLIPRNFDQNSFPVWLKTWQENQLQNYIDPTMATGLSSLLAEGGIVRPKTTTGDTTTTKTTTTPTTTTTATPAADVPGPYYPDRLLQPGEIDPRVFKETPTKGGYTTISGGNTAGPRDANGDYVDPRDDPYSSVNNPGRAPNPKGMGKTIADLMKSF